MKHLFTILLICLIFTFAKPVSSSAGQLEDGEIAYKQGDFKTALAKWLPLAKQGYALVQTNIGVMYEAGQGVQQDYAEALKWYRKAAEQGDARGQANLGLMYGNGYGVRKDYGEAVNWYQKAAKQGNIQASADLGYAYAAGLGIRQDNAEGLKWLRKAAEQRWARAQANLGWMYRDGRGTKQDYAEALKWYRKAAEQGDADGESSLGWMYADGHGVKQDYVEAVKWFRSAAEQNHAMGQVAIGLMYANGTGVTKDFREALIWFGRAADHGNSQGQAFLGQMFEQGAGVRKDKNEALRLYKLSAAQPDAPDWVKQRLAKIESGQESVTPSTTADSSSDGGDMADLSADAVAAHSKISAGPAAAPTNDNQSKVALVIGNGSYRNAPALDNPHNDADAITAKLNGMGFRVIEGTDLDMLSLRQKIREFLNASDQADIALFFYAGHAIEVDGKNYLVPVDAKIEDQYDVEPQLVDVSMITDSIGAGGKENKVGILFLDACRNNPFEKVLSHGKRSIQVGSGLAEIEGQGGGLFVGFATAPHKVAADGEGQKHSPFTTALLDHLATTGLEVGLMMTRVNAEVYRLTKGEQNPWHNSGLRTEVYLAGQSKHTEESPAQPNADAPPAAPGAVPSTGAGDNGMPLPLPPPPGSSGGTQG